MTDAIPMDPAIQTALQAVAWYGSPLPEYRAGQRALQAGLIADDTGSRKATHRLTAKGMRALLDLGLADAPPLGGAAPEPKPEGGPLHPAVEVVHRFFAYDHLPAGKLRNVSSKFGELADEIAHDPDLQGPELTVALRKLLEAKDAAVRSALPPKRSGE